ncbi:hypothetical protein KW795_02450, partial [Candidatus Microgenomates bacterium]|nr:hypothetical protein [Candidatus Microgenomates bacterium]
MTQEISALALVEQRFNFSQKLSDELAEYIFQSALKYASDSGVLRPIDNVRDMEIAQKIVVQALFDGSDGVFPKGITKAKTAINKGLKQRNELILISNSILRELGSPSDAMKKSNAFAQFSLTKSDDLGIPRSKIMEAKENRRAIEKTADLTILKDIENVYVNRSPLIANLSAGVVIREM